MTAKTKRQAPPVSAELTVLIQIDADKWAELEAQGYTDTDIQHLIEKAVTFKKMSDSHAPIADIEEVRIRKYY